jgi:hypothetical protein
MPLSDKKSILVDFVDIILGAIRLRLEVVINSGGSKGPENSFVARKVDDPC